MDTGELIKVLAADAKLPRTSLPLIWWRAASLATVLAAIVFYATVGPRPDIAAAVGTFRVLFKFALMLTLADTAFGALRTFSRPEGSWRRALSPLAVVPALLIAAVVLELMSVPRETWSERAMGASNVYCTILIMMIGIGPLSLFLLALRHGAPTSPRISGAVAGLLAGGISATIYALHCTDDSPLFVAVWYGMALAGLAVLGSIAAPRLARW
jgi:hypothetical protein